ncbi:MAG: MBL fold metallo-hydrolase [Treponema sp.]|nr:MBL fold metallo-hydrolase [Treponema sp.]
MRRMVIMGLILGAAASGGYGSETDGIFTFRVGQFEVNMLVESERTGNASILVGAEADILIRYIPSEGFKHTANAFLIKSQEQNVLIDTGTGAGNIIIDKIKKLGIQPENIDVILLTHLHGDHFGSLQREGKAVFPKAKVYLSEKELDYFTGINPNQSVIAALAPYSMRMETFDPGKIGSVLTEIVPGIKAIAAYGHTPGHTIYLLESGDEKFLIMGDLLHVALVQFPFPQISATYDMDAAAAASIRREVFDYAAKNKIPVGSMHIVYPGAGEISADGAGFRFTPKK